MPAVAQTVLFTVLALLAFAANSLLTRLALAAGQIDAGSFTFLRLAAGAAALAVLVRLRAGARARVRGRGLVGPLALFGYAAPFSFAYLRIGAALGAMILFAVVQITMVGWGIARGERPGARVWLGMSAAVAGLAALTWPSATRPDAAGILLMTVAGVAWAIYSLHGKQAADPVAANARNFLISASLGLLLGALTFRAANVHVRGVVLALVSGAVTSGLGYAIWYRALRGLPAAHAAVVQLSVPVVAATGAVLFLGETPSVRLVACGSVILAGVALAVIRRPQPARRAQ